MKLEVGPDDMVMELIVAEEKPPEEIPPPEPVQSLVVSPSFLHSPFFSLSLHPFQTCARP